MENTNTEKLIDESLNAIFYVEDVEARDLLKKLEDYIISQHLEKNNPALFEKLQKLVIQLKIVAFPHLSDSECENILREHYLESFEIEVPMEQRLIGKLFLMPYTLRDIPRERFKKALSQNQQKIGDLTIKQWIEEFERKYNEKTRNISASVDFVNTDSRAQKLSLTAKYMLKKMLHDYDYLLITSIPAIEPDLSRIVSNPPLDESLISSKSQQEMQDVVFQKPAYSSISQESINKSDQSFKKINLRDAIQKYKELNDQLITSLHIRLKNYPEPVRPSLKNWISDYTFKTGFDSHSSMDRGTYLFQSENTKALNAIDRRKLGYILKAYDENAEVEVDETSKQIVFPKNEPTWREDMKPTNASQEKEELKDIFERGREIEERIEKKAASVPQKGKFDMKPKFSPVNPDASASNENIRFSSPQKLPFENQNQKKEQAPAPIGPIRISPRERRAKLDEDFKNIINLKD